MLDYSYSQIRFQKTYGGNGDEIAHYGMQTSDGGYLICGSTTSFGSGGMDVYVVKTDSLGNKQWSKTFGGSNDDEARWALEDGGHYYVGGIMQSYGAGSRDGFLSCLDLSGNIMWLKNYGTSSDDYFWLFKFHKTIDNGFILCYAMLYPVKFQYTLIKTDINGNQQWIHTYGGTQTNVACDAFQLPDSGYFVTGFTWTYGMGAHDDLITRHDSLGHLIWSKTIGTATNEGALTVASLPNDNALIAAGVEYTLFGIRDLVFMKVNALTGQVLWAKEYGAATHIYGEPFTCIATLDGGFAADVSDWLQTSGHKMGMFKTDSLGDLLWAKTYGGSGDDIVYSVQNSKDSGFVIVGSTNSFGMGGLDMYFVKADKNGNSGNDTTCNQYVLQLQQGVYTYQTTFPSQPECFPVEVQNSYSLTAIDANDSISQSCSILSCNFTASDTVFCGEFTRCLNFYDHSTGNPTSWQWSFPGAAPSYSSLPNPDSICYNNPGTYSVRLIVGNSTGYDTLNVSPLIIYNAAMAVPTITVLGGDTLVSSFGFSYQWFLNGNAIGGATDSFYVALQGGTFSVQVSDSTRNCHSISGGVLITSVNFLNVGGVSIYPNPAVKTLVISAHDLNRGLWSLGKATVRIYNDVGSLMIETHDQTTFDIAEWPSGIYYVTFREGTTLVNRKFIKL